MYKLIICIETLNEPFILDEGWPQFLHQAEKMPGLVREAHSQITSAMFGQNNISAIHELFFETHEDLQNAMISPQGQAAGYILQRITNGQMSLWVAEHKEDEIENLRKYKEDDEDTG